MDLYLDDSSLDDKLKIIEMIDRLDINQKVGRIFIKISPNNPINAEIMRTILNNYNNIYRIDIQDGNGSVDNVVHGLIKQLVMKSVLVRFTVLIGGGLEGLGLLKGYNSVVAKKQYLEYLYYYYGTTINRSTRSE